MSREDNLLEDLLPGDLGEPPYRSCAINRSKRGGRDADLFGDACRMIEREVACSDVDGLVGQRDQVERERDQVEGLRGKDPFCDGRLTPDKLYNATRRAATLEGNSQACDDHSKQQWVAAMLRSPFQFDCMAKRQTLSVLDVEIAWGVRSGAGASQSGTAVRRSGASISRLCASIGQSNAALKSQRFMQQTELESYEGVGLVWLTQSNTTSWANKKRLQFEEL